MPRGKSREMPNNIEAERSVLACCMLSQEFASRYAPTLSAQDFYRPAHQSIIAAVRTLVARGKPCDQITVHDYLASRGSRVTRSQIVEICDNTFALSNAVGHLEIVRRCSLQRRIIRCCVEIEAMAYDPQEDPESVRKQAIAAIMSLVSANDGEPVAEDEPGRP